VTLYEHNRKIVCPHRGYKRDRTDPRARAARGAAKRPS